MTKMALVKTGEAPAVACFLAAGVLKITTAWTLRAPCPPAHPPAPAPRASAFLAQWTVPSLLHLIFTKQGTGVGWGVIPLGIKEPGP